jgi:hypothetical protein
MGTTARWYQISLRRLLLFKTVVAACLAWLRFEWVREVAPDGGGASVLLGPLYFLRHYSGSGDIRDGVLLTALLLPCIFAVILKPNPVTVVLSLLALLAWMFFGLCGQGASC